MSKNRIVAVTYELKDILVGSNITGLISSRHTDYSSYIFKSILTIFARTEGDTQNITTMQY